MTNQDIAAKLIRNSIENFKLKNNISPYMLDIAIGHISIRIHIETQNIWNSFYPAFSWQTNNFKTEPDVEIYALEGNGKILSPWSINDFLDGNRIRGLDSGRVLGAFNVEYSLLNVFDRSTQKGIFWIESTKRLPEWEIGAPLRTILTWALFDHGLHLIHSAGIGKNENGVLLVGPGGSGKSTSTAICLQNKFKTTGDDYCAANFEGTPRIFGVYGLLKLIPKEIGTSWFSDYPELTQRSDGKKHFDLTKFMTTSLVLKAIVFPRVSNNTESPIMIAKRDVLTRLIPSIYSQDIYNQGEQFKLLVRISNSVKSFRLDVGPNISSIPQIIESVCQR